MHWSGQSSGSTSFWHIDPVPVRVSFGQRLVFNDHTLVDGHSLITRAIARRDEYAEDTNRSLSTVTTVSVIWAVPVCPAAGVIVTVRLLPLPPNTTLALGISVVLLDCFETVSKPTAVSSSPTVN